MLVWFFFRSCGSNSPFRSRGTDTSTSPKLVRRFFAAVDIPAVVRSFVLVVVFAVTKILIQFSFQTVLHKFGNGFLEQVLDVVHAIDVRNLQQFTDLCSAGFFFRASILSGHIFSSILMLLFYTSPEVYTIIGMVSAGNTKFFTEIVQFKIIWFCKKLFQ